ncbi:hypothetical protein LTR85_004146 [Meristemomyces frigidus]|nr:hypothetical protein LTR85_004146 [Meristemomyces frigidus]
MWHWLAATSYFWLLLTANTTNTTGFISVQPSLYWDGSDGLWSTFQVQIGRPAQVVRLLPGTSANAGNCYWVVIPQGCTEVNANVSDCADERGYTFSSNLSTSWSTERLANGGLFELDTYEEGQLGLTSNAYYGFDTVQLGLDGSGAPTLRDQLVAGFATNDFWLGSLGLSPVPFNFTSLDNRIPSTLSTLKNQSIINSTSWAYTAGAAYKDPPVFGSLTLGGYDAARYDANRTLSAVPFGSDFSRDFLIGIESITYDTLGSSPLLASEIYAFIDSMVTQMWLPIDVCEAFETAFNLTWNDTAELYLVSEEAHSSLLAQNPTTTFTLGTTSGSKTIAIQLPYAALDLNISTPYVDSTSRYFPLKRAENASQYTLGRVFLQEAYVIADYNRSVFQISQALFPSSDASQDLRPVTPPGVSGTGSTARARKGMHLDKGAIAGIVLGAIAMLLMFAPAVLVCVRKRRSGPSMVQAAGTKEEKDDDEVAELPPDERAQVEMSAEDSAVYEFDAHNQKPSELQASLGTLGKYELPGERYIAEIEGVPKTRVFELGGESIPAAELGTA